MKDKHPKRSSLEAFIYLFIIYYYYLLMHNIPPHA